MRFIYNKKVKQVLLCIFTILILIRLVSYLADLTERKASSIKYEEFFTEEGEFDVLFMGTSHVMNDIFPMELWNDYGIVSYNFGGHGNAIATSYWVMKMALDYTSPKLVVIDCLGLSKMVKTSTSYSNVHLSFDAFPLNMTKLKAVIDLMDDEEMQKQIANSSPAVTEQRTALGLLWGFSVYHSRWNELQKNDFVPGKNVEKGAESRISVAVPNPILKVERENKLQQDTISIEYLEKMIIECQNRGIDVLLTYLPFPATESQYHEANRVYDIAEKYSLNYINFLDMDLVDYTIDCYDPDSHLNPSGARKVTDFLGAYIAKNYFIADKRTSALYDLWHIDYEAYKQYKIKNLKAQTQLDKYLMLLADKSFDITIEFHDNRIFYSEYYCNLFQNLGVDMERLDSDVDFLAIRSWGEHVSYVKGFFDRKVPTDTCIGSFFVNKMEDGNYSVSWNQGEYYATSDDNLDADIRIVVVDKKTSVVVDVAQFDIVCDLESKDLIVSASGFHK